jgi:large subunit ribosomal protein L9
MMKVILQEDVANLGVVGDLVTVRDGYGRNYLIPTGKAVFASVRSIQELEHQKRLAAHRRKQATAAAEINRRRIENLSVVITAKVAPPTMGDDGQPVLEKLQKLFGSITTRDLTKVLADSDVKIDHRRVAFNEQVRTVGKYVASIRLDGGITATLPFWVIPEGATGDIETEKKRVEAAQEAARKEREAALAAERAAAAAAEKERLRQLEAKKAAEAAEKAREEGGAAAPASDEE